MMGVKTGENGAPGGTAEWVRGIGAGKFHALARELLIIALDDAGTKIPAMAVVDLVIHHNV